MTSPRLWHKLRCPPHVGTIDLSGRANHAVDIAAGATWVVIVACRSPTCPPSTKRSTGGRAWWRCSRVERVSRPGPELLARHQLVGIIDTLPQFYSEWEQWSAELAESHTTYPVMLLFRSPDPWFSWLVGLWPSWTGQRCTWLLRLRRPRRSQGCASGWASRRSIGSPGPGVDGRPDPNPEGPIELTFEEFAEAVAMLDHVGFPMERTAEDAWPDFRGWRVNYETVAYACATPDRPARSLVGQPTPPAIGCRGAKATSATLTHSGGTPSPVIIPPNPHGARRTHVPGRHRTRVADDIGRPRYPFGGSGGNERGLRRQPSTACPPTDRRIAAWIRLAS